uniref:Uncharacterized protein n=1 Tax=Mus musculus TaxID=10090 RepID=Q3UU51_MOUSE|nr:unnamed protein product [Mus musculus]
MAEPATASCLFLGFAFVSPAVTMQLFLSSVSEEKKKKKSGILQASIFLQDGSKVNSFVSSQLPKCHLIPSIYHSLWLPACGRVTSSSTTDSQGL